MQPAPAADARHIECLSATKLFCSGRRLQTVAALRIELVRQRFSAPVATIDLRRIQVLETR